ncbi:hypothetical protein SNEBB_000301 [Seison nebaliae]|nr:hypothetical protein SNEBB_000301 [Seison nebaliae]
MFSFNLISLRSFSLSTTTFLILILINYHECGISDWFTKVFTGTSATERALKASEKQNMDDLNKLSLYTKKLKNFQSEATEKISQELQQISLDEIEKKNLDILIHSAKHIVRTYSLTANSAILELSRVSSSSLELLVGLFLEETGSILEQMFPNNRHIGKEQKRFERRLNRLHEYLSMQTKRQRVIPKRLLKSIEEHEEKVKQFRNGTKNDVSYFSQIGNEFYKDFFRLHPYRMLILFLSHHQLIIINSISYYEKASLDESPTKLMEMLCRTFESQPKIVSVAAALRYMKPDKALRSIHLISSVMQYSRVPLYIWHHLIRNYQEVLFQSKYLLQVSPSYDDEIKAMFSLFVFYNWQAFNVVVTDGIGHRNFLNSIRKYVNRMEYNYQLYSDKDVNRLRNRTFSYETYNQRKLMKVVILEAEKLQERRTGVNYAIDRLQLLSSYPARITIVFGGREVKTIFKAAKRLNLLTNEYLWLLSSFYFRNRIRGVDDLQNPLIWRRSNLPHGLLGVYYAAEPQMMHQNDMQSTKDDESSNSPSNLNQYYTNQSIFSYVKSYKTFYHELNKIKLGQDVSCSKLNGKFSIRQADMKNARHRMFNTIFNKRSQIMYEDFFKNFFNEESKKGHHMKLEETQKQINFNIVGQRLKADFQILNFHSKNTWNQIGSWNGLNFNLTVSNIVWPGKAAVPPSGKPKKYFLRVVTLRESPFVIMTNMNDDGKCGSGTVRCNVSDPVYATNKKKHVIGYKSKLNCCTGFCIDILEQLATKLNFRYELYEVEDRTWGGRDENGEWNGLIHDVITKKADIVMTSLKITQARSESIDFTVPYMDTGIGIIVSARSGAISTTAFLQPYDYVIWIMILFVSLHSICLSLFLFEYIVNTRTWHKKKKNIVKNHQNFISSNNNLTFTAFIQKKYRNSLYKTELSKQYISTRWTNDLAVQNDEDKPAPHITICSSLWLVWSLLFRATVKLDHPTTVAGRFLANIWACFCLAFTASYTANLAAFMITKEHFFELSGIQDARLINPYKPLPAFRFGTVKYGSTEENIRRNFPKMNEYMNVYKKRRLEEGIDSLKNNELDAFLYDAVVLEYTSSQDEGCRLRNTGKWYSMTGYGVGLPIGSMWKSKISNELLQMQANGVLERLQRYWFMGACKSKNNDKDQRSSQRLGVLNFISVFLLLITGVTISLITLFIEYFYIRFSAKNKHFDEEQESDDSNTDGDSIQLLPLTSKLSNDNENDENDIMRSNIAIIPVIPNEPHRIKRKRTRTRSQRYIQVTNPNYRSTDIEESAVERKVDDGKIRKHSKRKKSRSRKRN